MPSPFSLFRPYRGRLFALLVLIVIAALGEAVGLALLSILLNQFVNPSGAALRPSLLAPISAAAQDSPRLYLLMLGLAYVGKSLLALWANYGSFSLALRIADDWRSRLIRAYLRVPLTRLDKQQGAMLHVVLDEPSLVGLGLGAAGLFAQNVLSAVTIFVVLLSLSPLVTLGLMLVGLVAVVMVALVSRYTHMIAVRRSQAFSDGYAYLTEMLSALKQLRLFNLEVEAERRASGHLEKMRSLQRKANMVGSSPRLLIEIVFLAGLAAMFVVLMPRLGEAAALSALGLSVVAALRLLPSFSASAGTWVQMQQAWPAMKRVASELAQLEHGAGDSPDHAVGRPVMLQERIEVEEVYFSYPGRKLALVGVDLEIPEGSFTAIVGPSGSGKSTLIDLLCGFYVPEKGRILVDGIDLRQISIGQWRQQLGVVLQDGFLLSGTIRENLCLLRPDCPDDLLREVVDLVGAARFIQDLPHGYETRVGERGLTLSGGQRQRLALARVLVREPRILLMDEATSALDVESEEALQEGIERLRGRLTMVVIAHRLTTVRRADRIYVLENGKAVESGRHELLMQRGGLYAAMRRAAEIGVTR